MSKSEPVARICTPFYLSSKRTSRTSAAIGTVEKFIFENVMERGSFSPYGESGNAAAELQYGQVSIVTLEQEMSYEQDHQVEIGG